MNIRTGAAAEHRSRKLEHIEISLNCDTGFAGTTTGLEKYRIIHQAVPEIDLDAVDLSVRFLGEMLSAPVLISSMVGGIDEAGRINRNLAAAAQRHGVAMGVGSQRCAIDDPGCAESFMVRDVAPDIYLCANIGAVQLNYGYGAGECISAVEMIDADALILHLNPLQEALQPGGNTRFSGLLKKIETICRTVRVPVIAKEVCFGISETAARDLANAGVRCIDVAGAGGTSWSEVERRRAINNSDKSVAQAFASWGIPTAESVLMARSGAPDLPVIASGGIRTGIDAAKAIALGADIAGIGMPLFRAACESAESAIESLGIVIETLRRAMFCAGASCVHELNQSKLFITGEERACQQK